MVGNLNEGTQKFNAKWSHISLHNKQEDVFKMMVRYND